MSYAAPMSYPTYSAPAYSAPLVGSISASLPMTTMAAPMTYAAPTIAAPMTYAAPTIAPTYAAPAYTAPISYAAPTIAPTYSAPLVGSISASLPMTTMAAPSYGYGYGSPYVGAGTIF